MYHRVKSKGMSRKFSSSSASDKFLSGGGSNSGQSSRENMHASYNTSYDDTESSLLNRFRMSQTQPLPPSSSRHNHAPGSNGVSGSGNHSSKLVHGSQFRMPQRLAPPCEQCDVLSNNLKKSKETIRSLKLQISRLEERLHDKRPSYNSNTIERDPATDISAEYENLKTMYNNLVRKNKDMESELNKVKTENHNNILQHEENQRALQRTNQILNEDLESTSSQYNDIKDRCRVLTVECNDKNQKLSEINQTLNVKIEWISDLEKELEFLRSGIQSSNDSLLNGLREEIEKLKSINSSLNNTMTKNKSEFDLKNNENMKSILLLEEQVQTLQDGVSDRDTVINERNETIDHLRNRISGLENQQTVTQADLGNIKNELQQEKQASSVIKAEKNNLLKELQELNKKYNDLILRVTKESEVTAKALEKAISSSVRLCVVAPTVNVHIADKKLRMQSKTSERELKTFLEDQVLTKYVHLYNQENEDMAPDGKTPLRKWVSKMLGEMQSSIEAHINNAMKGAGSSGSGSEKE